MTKLTLTAVLILGAVVAGQEPLVRPVTASFMERLRRDGPGPEGLDDVLLARLNQRTYLDAAGETIAAEQALDNYLEMSLGISISTPVSRLRSLMRDARAHPNFRTVGLPAPEDVNAQGVIVTVAPGYNETLAASIRDVYVQRGYQRWSARDIRTLPLTEAERRQSAAVADDVFRLVFEKQPEDVVRGFLERRRAAAYDPFGTKRKVEYRFQIDAFATAPVDVICVTADGREVALRLRAEDLPR